MYASSAAAWESGGYAWRCIEDLCSKQVVFWDVCFFFFSFFCISVASQLSVIFKNTSTPTTSSVCSCWTRRCLAYPPSPNKHVSPTSELIFETNVLLTWPLIPVRQPCAWVMLWNRRVHICLCHGPQHRVSRVHREGRRDHRHNGVPRLADKKNPSPCCFSFLRWVLLKMTWKVWCMWNRPGTTVVGGADMLGAPPSKLAHH